jgi:hypothetical protein
MHGAGLIPLWVSNSDHPASRQRRQPFPKPALRAARAVARRAPFAAAHQSRCGTTPCYARVPVAVGAAVASRTQARSLECVRHFAEFWLEAPVAGLRRASLCAIFLRSTDHDGPSANNDWTPNHRGTAPNDYVVIRSGHACGSINTTRTCRRVRRRCECHNDEQRADCDEIFHFCLSFSDARLPLGALLDAVSGSRLCIKRHLAFACPDR